MSRITPNNLAINAKHPLAVEGTVIPRDDLGLHQKAASLVNENMGDGHVAIEETDIRETAAGSAIPEERVLIRIVGGWVHSPRGLSPFYRKLQTLKSEREQDQKQIDFVGGRSPTERAHNMWKSLLSPKDE